VPDLANSLGGLQSWIAVWAIFDRCGPVSPQPHQTFGVEYPDWVVEY